MTAPWDPDGLWMKAKLFINRALDDDPARTFDERALWASLALELLAKAALARASPLLIATPTEDGKNLLAAVGLVSEEATFKTIPAKTLFKRCARAFKPFNDAEATRIAEERNGFLHSAGADITPVPEEAWWPRYWALALVLVNACDRDIEALVGPSHVGAVEAALARNQRNLESRLEMLYERARQRLARREAGEMRENELREWDQRNNAVATWRYSIQVQCPACDSDDAVLEGDDVLSSEWQGEMVSESDYDVWLNLEVAAESFYCGNCHCVLNSFDLIDAAGFLGTFEATGNPEDFVEEEYGND